VIAFERPLIAGVVTPRMLQHDLALARTAGPDVLEYRADMAEQPSAERIRADLSHIGAALSLPLIFTLRDTREGGRCMLPVAARAPLFRAALPYVNAVDVELRNTAMLPLIRTACARYRTTVILSLHDFEGTPAVTALHAAVSKAIQARGDVVKMATTCHTRAEVRRLLGVARTVSGIHVSVVGMGPYGADVRRAAPRYGAVLGYASLSTAVASGQLSVAELRHAWEDSTHDSA
jgi:3-dehydroquinate dehydratase type I